MKVASKIETVKRRIDDYVWREDTLTSRRLRHVLKSHFGHFQNIAIMGGMVRDFARVGKLGFRSDVDLVIDAPAGEVADAARLLGARNNVFGGHSVSRPGWNLDFWALESTWSIREGHVRGDSLSDLTRSTFFDYDAILYDVWRRRILHPESYLQRLQQGVMDINLLPNPTVTGNLYRAVRRILLWDLSAGPKLFAFISDNLTDAGFRDIVAMDNRKSPTPFLYKYGSSEALRTAVLNREHRVAMATYYGEQLKLPGLDSHLAEGRASVSSSGKEVIVQA